MLPALQLYLLMLGPSIPVIPDMGPEQYQRVTLLTPSPFSVTVPV